MCNAEVQSGSGLHPLRISTCKCSLPGCKVMHCCMYDVQIALFCSTCGQVAAKTNIPRLDGCVMHVCPCTSSSHILQNVDITKIRGTHAACFCHNTSYAVHMQRQDRSCAHIYIAGLHNGKAKGAGHNPGTAFLHHKSSATPDGDTVAGVLFCVHPIKHSGDADPIACYGKAAITVLAALHQPPVPWFKHPADM